MATNPNTLLPTPQDAAMAQQAQLAAMQERGREAIRAYLLENKGRATLEGAQSIGAQFGLNIPQGAQAAIDWANREGTDVNLIPITTDVLAEPGAVAV